VPGEELLRVAAGGPGQQRLEEGPSHLGAEPPVGKGRDGLLRIASGRNERLPEEPHPTGQREQRGRHQLCRRVGDQLQLALMDQVAPGGHGLEPDSIGLGDRGVEKAVDCGRPTGESGTSKLEPPAVPAEGVDHATGSATRLEHQGPDTGLLEPQGGQQPREAGPDDGHRWRTGQGGPIGTEQAGTTRDRGKGDLPRRFTPFQLVSGGSGIYFKSLATIHRSPADVGFPRALRGPVPIDTVQTPVALFDKCRQFTRAREAQAAGLYPYFKPISESEDTVVVIEGQKRMMLGSNNYLGLTHPPNVLEAARKALTRYGSGCTGSRFLNGSLDLHEQLEEELAAFLGKEAAVVFSTGYGANLGMISGLVGRGETVYLDKLDHACIVDGAKLA